MRLLNESILQIWKARKASVREEVANTERDAKAIQEKLNRLDEAFLFDRSIDIDTYDRHAEKLRGQLTLARVDRHSAYLDELDVEAILAFAERVLPRAADLWVQASLEQRQRFQQLFYPEGISFACSATYNRLMAGAFLGLSGCSDAVTERSREIWRRVFAGPKPP
jgi:hypothetical protein